MFRVDYPLIAIEARVVTGTLRRLLLLLIAVALAASACSSGGGNGASSTSRTSAASLPPLGKPNPLGAKWDWARVDNYKPYLASLSGGATFYDFAWWDVEPTEAKRNWSTIDDVAKNARA